jgi:hypothetical protein
MLTPQPALAAWLTDGTLSLCVACGKPATTSCYVEAGPEHDYLIPGQIKDQLYKWLRERRALTPPRYGVTAPTCDWHGRGHQVWPIKTWLALYDALLVMRLRQVPELRAEIAATRKVAGLLGDGQ